VGIELPTVNELPLIFDSDGTKEERGKPIFL
jgi:hypothetical protein